ncbi:MAG: isochorismate synthase [Gemmatimonadetes bacterium]|nr:isochorismate synthase [Gemmatimonadota bacterium]
MAPLTSPGLCRIRREVAPVRPDLFLHLAAAGPRGFWASAHRWIAHCGVVGEVAVDSGAPDPGSSRFSTVQDQSAQVFARVRGDGTRARLFGGFSFSPRPDGDSVWARFPPALFHLPEVELEHHPDREVCTLVVRARDRGAAEDAWRRWEGALSGGTAAMPPGTSLLQGGPGSLQAGTGSLRGPASSVPHGAAPVRGPDQAPPLGYARRSGTERATWGRMVWEALSTIGAGEAEKVVLARTLDVAPAIPVPPADLVAALWEENHGSHVFLFEPVPGRAIVGAAPETIVTLAGGVFRATATAGSAAVGADSVATAQLARRLFDSEKDRAEHDVVVRDMVARLAALGCTVRRDVEPHVLALARIQHLETKIAAEVPEGISVLDILASLHPTPAVCGMPRNVALSVLEESERFDRGWYSGPVGWFDSRGEGIFVPALRSAVSAGAGWRLFAGAGIVPGSDPALEWEETELKFRPVLRALERAGATGSSAAGSG